MGDTVLCADRGEKLRWAIVLCDEIPEGDSVVG